MTAMADPAELADRLAPIRDVLAADAQEGKITSLGWRVSNRPGPRSKWWAAQKEVAHGRSREGGDSITIQSESALTLHDLVHRVQKRDAVEREKEARQKRGNRERNQRQQHQARRVVLVDLPTTAQENADV